jgi:ribonuclease P protein component
MMTLQEFARQTGTANVLWPLRGDTVSGITQVKFPRTARLLRHADFRRVYEQGRRHFSASLTAFYVTRQEPDIKGPRIGFTVSKALGGAVDRNRMKRRLREATREAWNGFSATVDIVVNPKKTVLTADYATLVEEISKALAVIEKHVLAGQANPRPRQDVSRDNKSKPRAGKAQR